MDELKKERVDANAEPKKAVGLRTYLVTLYYNPYDVMFLQRQPKHNTYHISFFLNTFEYPHG